MFFKQAIITYVKSTYGEIIIFSLQTSTTKSLADCTDIIKSFCTYNDDNSAIRDERSVQIQQY